MGIAVHLCSRLQRVGLTDLQRLCLARYYYDGWTQAEIAAELGIHRVTVREHIKVGMAKLVGAGLHIRNMEIDGRELIFMDGGMMDRLGPAEILGVA